MYRPALRVFTHDPTRWHWLTACDGRVGLMKTSHANLLGFIVVRCQILNAGRECLYVEFISKTVKYNRDSSTDQCYDQLSVAQIPPDISRPDNPPFA